MAYLEAKQDSQSRLRESELALKEKEHELQLNIDKVLLLLPIL